MAGAMAALASIHAQGVAHMLLLQVSLLRADGRNIHWFTATPSPDRSIFKPLR
jgi:hypothetical protein